MTCNFCSKPVHKKPSESRSQRTGRPWKHTFCGNKCHRDWEKLQVASCHKARSRVVRTVWGTIPVGRFDVATARPYGKAAEKRAVDHVLPGLGFTDIVNFSNMSNQFFVDFVATYQGKRVLVDATIKMKAYIPEKVKLADALRMPLYILHLSAIYDDVFWLHKAPVGAKCLTVPAKYIRDLESRL